MDIRIFQIPGPWEPNKQIQGQGQFSRFPEMYWLPWQEVGRLGARDQQPLNGYTLGPRQVSYRIPTLTREVRHTRVQTAGLLSSELENQVMPLRNQGPTARGAATVKEPCISRKCHILLPFIPQREALSSRRHCGSPPGHCFSNQGSF